MDYSVISQNEFRDLLNRNIFEVLFFKNIFDDNLLDILIETGKHKYVSPDGYSFVFRYLDIINKNTPARIRKLINAGADACSIFNDMTTIDYITNQHLDQHRIECIRILTNAGAKISDHISVFNNMNEYTRECLDIIWVNSPPNISYKADILKKILIKPKYHNYTVDILEKVLNEFKDISDISHYVFMALAIPNFKGPIGLQIFEMLLSHGLKKNESTIANYIFTHPICAKRVRIFMKYSTAYQTASPTKASIVIDRFILENISSTVDYLRDERDRRLSLYYRDREFKKIFACDSDIGIKFLQMVRTRDTS